MITLLMRQTIDGRRTLWFECQRSTKSWEPIGDKFARCPHEKGKNPLVLKNAERLSSWWPSMRTSVIADMIFLLTLHGFPTSTAPDSNWWDTRAKSKGLSKWKLLLYSKLLAMIISAMKANLCWIYAGEHRTWREYWTLQEGKPPSSRKRGVV